LQLPELTGIKPLVAKYRFLISGGFACVSAWYAYWIYYDVGVWGKPISEVNALNFFGLAVSILLVFGGLWQGRKLSTEKAANTNLKPILKMKPPTVSSPSETRKIETTPVPPKLTPKIQTLKTDTSATKSISAAEKPKLVHPIIETTATVEQKPSLSEPKNPNCPYTFGYLHNRKESKEIPTECLMCQKVIQCISTET
jgi:hypothetical protein